ncbi:hypothetical protein JCM10296v2_003552 [Rhodotorula toruloides]
MDRLPNELLSVIVAIAAATLRHAQTETGTIESSSPRPRTRWLSLVSRRFHTVVQSTMFDSIVVTSEKQLRLLAALLEDNPSPAAKPISLVVLATDSAQPKHAAKAWRKAVLRFGRCRPNVRRLEVYGRDDREKFGYFDLSWLDSIQPSLEELIVSHLWIAHHESLDNLRLAALRRFTAADYWHYAPPPPHDPSDSRPPRVYGHTGIPKFRRFLRCMPAINVSNSSTIMRTLQGSAGIFSKSLPPMLQSVRDLTVERQALGSLLHKQHPLAHSPTAQQHLPRGPFSFCGSNIQHLTALYTRGPPHHMEPRNYDSFERLLYIQPSLRSLTFVNMAAFHMPDFDQRMHLSLEQAHAAGFALDLQLRVISAEAWVAKRDDLVRDGWTTPKVIAGGGGPRSALQRFLREQGIATSQH